MNLNNILNGITQKVSPLNLSTASESLVQRLFTFQPELRTGYDAPVKKSVLHRAALSSVNYSLAKEFNRNFLMWGIMGNVWYKVSVG